MPDCLASTGYGGFIFVSNCAGCTMPPFRTGRAAKGEELAAGRVPTTTGIGSASNVVAGTTGTAPMVPLFNAELRFSDELTGCVRLRSLRPVGFPAEDVGSVEVSAGRFTFAAG